MRRVFLWVWLAYRLNRKHMYVVVDYRFRMETLAGRSELGFFSGSDRTDASFSPRPLAPYVAILLLLSLVMYSTNSWNLGSCTIL